MNEQTDYYSLLGVKRRATVDEIKRAYRKLVFRYHPDRSPNDEEAAAKLKAVLEAYDVLSNSDRRASYDNATWTPFEDSQEAARGGASSNGFHFSYESKAKLEPEPRCPQCAAVGILHVVSRKSTGATGRGKQFISSPFQVIFCDQCGHVYGITGC